MYNIINLRMCYPDGTSADTDQKKGFISLQTGKLNPYEVTNRGMGINDIKTLNICLNGNTLNFGHGGQIKGVGRVNICDCGVKTGSGDHTAGSITTDNAGIVKVIVDGVEATRSMTSRREPCIFTTGLGLYNIKSVENMSNETDFSTGNAAAGVPESAAFYGYFKPTTNNLLSTAASGVNPDEIFYLTDYDKKEIPLAYYVEMDSVKFSNIQSKTGSGAVISLGVRSTLWINDCTFEKCTSKNNGGAICAASNYFWFNSCKFEECHSGGDGGAVYLNNYGDNYQISYRIKNTSGNIENISNNEIINYHTGFNDCTFTGNYNSGKDSVVEGSTDTFGGRGGAICLIGVNKISQFENIVAKKNHANLSGGFLYWEDSETDSSTTQTVFKNVKCGNTFDSQTGAITSSNDDNYAGDCGGTFHFSSAGIGTGYINVLLTNNSKGDSYICGSRTLGYNPAETVPKKDASGNIIGTTNNAGNFTPAYETNYDPVLQKDYFLGSFGGGIYAEGVHLQLGEPSTQGGGNQKVNILNCYANDGGA